MKILSVFFCLFLCSCASSEFKSIEEIVTSSNQVKLLATGYKFTEGPANDPEGNIYFTDIPNNHIVKWSIKEQKATVFLENSQGANGLWINDNGEMFACLGEAQKISKIDLKSKKSTDLATSFNGKPFNKPNDLWVDAVGGVYFSDPNYGARPKSQDGEHVYYRKVNGEVIRVVADFIRPNGLIGTKDGKILYITDRDAKVTYSYTIQADGTLTNKKKMCDIGSDGMTLDEYGNLYLTTDTVVVFAPDGRRIGSIKVPEIPANICFGGADGKTLFITARKGFYSVNTTVKGMYSR